MTEGDASPASRLAIAAELSAFQSAGDSKHRLGRA